jgi:signal peptidase II
MTKSTRFATIALITFASVGCDQAAKHIARAALVPTSSISLLAGSLHFELAENRGGFLSLGANLPAAVRQAVFGVGVPVLLVALALGAIWFRRLRRPQVVGLALLLGGGLGNLIDRLLRDGAVTDFVRVSVGPVSTGIFNLSDIVIALGVVTFAIAHESDEPAPATGSERDGEASRNPATPPR